MGQQTTQTRADTTGRSEAGWVSGLRLRARKRFSSMTWPTPADEEWRRTDITRMDFGQYMDGRSPAPPAAPGTNWVPPASAPAAIWEDGGDQAAGTAVMTDDDRERIFLCADAEAQGVRLLPLGRALEEHEDLLRPLFEKSLAEADNRFIPWHLAEMERGLFLSIPHGVVVKGPILIGYTAGGGRPLSSPHVVVHLGQGARAVVARFIIGDGRLLLNDDLDMILSDGASLTFWDLQAMGSGPLHVSHAAAVVGRDASLRHFSAIMGGGLVKTRIDCVLSGSGAEALLSGMYLCGASQHMDIRTVQRHMAPSCTSRALYKGAVRDGGRTIFQGLIEVGAMASGTDAFLTNKNLILSDGARSDSIPSLKIGNNDVKCSHGSTTSRIDDEHIFYLESRGVPPEEARRMIVTGYFEELLSGSPPAFAGRVLERTQTLLATHSA